MQKFLGGNVIGFKSVSYYLVLKAVSDYSLDQAIMAMKASERDKLKTYAMLLMFFVIKSKIFIKLLFRSY